ncbi:MAG: hypothetical protein GX295_05005 [Syntrophomonadaceae bacterium]|nr:hypothetical protein [Syntrophomonadaceae bacterium]
MEKTYRVFLAACSCPGWNFWLGLKSISGKEQFKYLCRI